MKRIGLIGAVLAAMVFGTMAVAFDAYFSDAAGNKIGRVWEGRQVYIAIKDPDKGAYGIDQFAVDLVVFDMKTGAYLGYGTAQIPTATITNAVFRELGGIGSGLYFWVAGPNSSTKVALQVGSRHVYTTIEGQTHVLGTVSPGTISDWEGDAFDGIGWKEGAWEYVDQEVLDDADLTDGVTPVNVAVTQLPRSRATARVDFEGLTHALNATPNTEEEPIQGRFENMDTLILIAADGQDERNIDQDQVKIVDTVGKFKAEPARVEYGCPGCYNIVVTVEDPDENLNCNEIEYVPVFVILNPGSWNPQTYGANSFCSLMMYGGFKKDVVEPVKQPIRWYNIYSTNRRLDYEPRTPDNPWWADLWGDGLLKVVLFVPETSVDSGIFELNLGSLEDFQQYLWDEDKARGYRLPMGTIFAFYYIDPNDFDDMDLATIEVGDRPHSQVFLTDATGIPLSEVKLGAGWGGLYIRVYDGDANVEACCPDKVVVHLCDPHNEDDSEYVIIDEISANSGIFFTQTGIPLLPVWDAVGGYQLVFDDWNMESFNEDTIFVRYNSVDYTQTSLNALGDGNPNDGYFPPAINYEAARNQYWDVSFAKVKVSDYQVFDGTTHRMRLLDGNYQPVTKEIPVSGFLYLEVTDLDQNEHPGLRELTFGGWNKDAYTGDDRDRADTSALGATAADTDGDQDANEDSAPIWWRGGPNAAASDAGNSDVMTPQGAVLPAPALGDTSITGIPETVKILIWNAQRGHWERMDLRETAVGSGIFRSTVCVLVSDARRPGDGNLGSKAGDTIMAFYQDPSNHSDISIISVKVSEGGAGAVTPPVVALSVAFDRPTYYPGDTVTITVIDEQYAGALEIVGPKVLVLLDKDGVEIRSWDKLTAVEPGKFQVTYTLPETVKLGTITARYTDPYVAGRTAQATARVVPKALTNVTAITVSPNPFQTTTTFTIVAEPAGAVAEKITIVIYDLTGAKVAEISGTNTASVTWNGGNLRNGAYIYVATVEGAGKVFGPFKGFVYIER